MKQFIFKYPVTNGLFWGLIGGFVFILAEILLPQKPEVTIQLTSYFICVIASVLTIKINPSENKYLKLYSTSLLAFILVFLVFYIYGYISRGIENGFNWIGVLYMSIIGFCSCALLTFLVTRNR